jgi:3,4-dihydroxy 2-butanone 4-phosphate synthase / GTP cyclohydrolase II
MPYNALVKSSIPSIFGDFDMWAFASTVEPMPHVVLTSKAFDASQPVCVRIHSECMTGDVFGSKRCDCGQQLQNALRYIQRHGGALIYLRQEGRGIGLVHKLEAYNLQDQGLDTVEANHELGFQADERSYQEAIEILKALGVGAVRLISNNPAKKEALTNAGIEVVEQIHIPTDAFDENQVYLRTKIDKMGHIFPPHP